MDSAIAVMQIIHGRLCIKLRININFSG